VLVDSFFVACSALGHRGAPRAENHNVTDTSPKAPDDEDVEDVRLAARAAGGDPDAQRGLVVRLFGSVTRTVRSLLRSDAEADDAVQVSMIEILRSSAGYRGDGSLERWASRIAARTTLHLVRRRRARAALVESDTDAAELAAAPPTGGAEADAGALEKYLAGLPEARRTCIVLRHVHGYSVEEIAEMTLVSPNTVKDRLLQGRAELRRSLQKSEGRSPAAGPLPKRRVS
jgi:RNA polymerase sigma-70 factor (ECF subfamily)